MTLQHLNTNGLQACLPRRLPFRPRQIETHLVVFRLRLRPGHASGAKGVQIETEGSRNIGLGIRPGKDRVRACAEGRVWQQAGGKDLRVRYVSARAQSLQVGIGDNCDSGHGIAVQWLRQIDRNRREIGTAFARPKCFRCRGRYRRAKRVGRIMSASAQSHDQPHSPQRLVHLYLPTTRISKVSATIDGRSPGLAGGPKSTVGR